jgi:Na+/proline symporter
MSNPRKASTETILFVADAGCGAGPPAADNSLAILMSITSHATRTAHTINESAADRETTASTANSIARRAAFPVFCRDIRNHTVIFGLHPADVLVLVGYLAGITALGIWVGKGAGSVSEFFMPRKFGKAVMIMSAFGAGTASDQAVTVSSATFRSGLSGIWYQWLWLFVTPFYWLIAPIFRRFRAVTTADVYSLRFSHSVAVLFSVVGIASVSVKIGVMLKGTGALLEACTGASVDPNLAIIVTAALFVLYGTLGGLTGAMVTDLVQGMLILLFSFMLIPFILGEVGGMAGIHQLVPDKTLLSLVAPGKISAFFVVMMGIQALVGIVAQPHIMGVCAAGKTEYEGRVGLMIGNFMKRICTVAWCVTAIGGIALYAKQGRVLTEINPDNVYGDMAQIFLPKLAPGALGLFVAATMAGVMGACDNFMLSGAALFTQNIYRGVWKGRTEAHYLWVGRVASLAVVIGGVWFALWVPNVIKALEIWFMIAPMMGIAFWLGLLWRRYNVAGAWATTIAGFGTWFLTTRVWFVTWLASMPFAEPLRLIWVEKGVREIYLPWQVLMYMGVAAFAVSPSAL